MNINIVKPQKIVELRADGLMRTGRSLIDTIRLKSVCREPDLSLSEPRKLGVEKLL